MLKPKRVTVLMNPELFALASQLAQETEKSVSEFMRLLLAEKLRERGIFYNPAWMKMPKGTRNDMETPEGRARALKQLADARAARRKRGPESAESASMLA